MGIVRTFLEANVFEFSSLVFTFDHPFLIQSGSQPCRMLQALCHGRGSDNLSTKKKKLSGSLTGLVTRVLDFCLGRYKLAFDDEKLCHEGCYFRRDVFLAAILLNCDLWQGACYLVDFVNRLLGIRR